MYFGMIQAVIKCFERPTVERIEENSKDVSPALFINSSGAHAVPGQPRGICSHCQPEGGAVANFIAARGLGNSVTQGDPRAYDTRVFER